VRIAIVTESFLPQVNGVTMSVLRICEQLTTAGHEVLVVAPGTGPREWAGARVVRVPSLPVPGYPSHRVAVPLPGLTAVLRDFRPDLVHLASPAVLGALGVSAAERLGVPTIAVYQTDLPAYAARYHAAGAAGTVWRWLRRIHGRSSRTLAPSSPTKAELTRHGIPRVHLWPRGVDLDRFHPGHRSRELRRDLGVGDGLLLGYVGRLAAEKEVDLLAGIQDLPGARLVVVGDGPQRGALERLLPRAHFLGQLSGQRLSEVFASLDVFVHTGPHETFCQAAQEALASGVPVVAPASGGLLDLVTEDVNGHLFDPGSGPGLEQAVRRAVQDPEHRGRLAEAARLSVQERSWEAIGAAYLEHCRQVLDEGRETGERRPMPKAA
jgi:phosphatidylinositol alpha 1,6-mannosyltransferase